jgi:hypothetical protein
MKSLVTALIIIATSAPSFGGEWGQTTSTAGGNTVEVATTTKKVKLIWQSTIVPGDELLLTMVSYDKEPFYKTYTFMGVSGGSLRVKSSSSKQGKAVEQQLAIEPTADGNFYFVPTELRNEAQIKITRAAGQVGYYSVSVARFPQ